MRRYNMRAGPVIVAVLLLAACSGASLPTSSPSPGVPASPGPTPAVGPTGQPTAQITDGWRELGSGLWLEDEVFAVAAASNDSRLEQLWARLGQPDPAPAVDFERELVLFLGMAGSSTCPERLERLFVDHAAGTVHGEWAAHEPGQACTDDLQAQSLLLAIDRALLPETPFVFSLREQPICPECPERPDQVIVDPTA
jgi:hypothetical protein